jgi:nucleoside-diphosphate-sugar epimerase
MNIFVTGASGYIGGSVGSALVQKGYRVKGLTRSVSVAKQLQACGIDPIVGDIDDSRLLIEQANQADAVINTANADHRPAVEALITAMQGSGKKLIHTSGTSIVGDDARGEFCSESVFNEYSELVIDPRKQARREIDLLVLGASAHNINSSVIVPSLIYGVGRGINKHSIQVPFLINNALEFGAVQIVGKGLNTWSNVHIDDLVDLYLLALEKAPPASMYFGENGEASFLDIAQSISKRLSIPNIEFLSAELAVEKWGMARALFTYGSNSRVRSRRGREELNWQPTHASVQNWIMSEYQVSTPIQD